MQFLIHIYVFTHSYKLFLSIYIFFIHPLVNLDGSHFVVLVSYSIKQTCDEFFVFFGLKQFFVIFFLYIFLFLYGLKKRISKDRINLHDDEWGKIYQLINLIFQGWRLKSQPSINPEKRKQFHRRLLRNIPLRGNK